MQWKFRSQMTVVLSVLTIALALMPGAWPASSTRAADAGKIRVAVLYNFEENGPQYPQDFIAQGRDGNLYSTTPYGGTSNDGTVYKITPAGNLSVLYDLSSYNGSTGLSLGTDGNFYGTTIYGGGGNGYGTVFKITPSGKMKVLAAFSGKNFDAYPDAPPIQASDGTFYGTDLGSAYGTGSTVYSMTPSGHKSTLFRFDHHKQGSNLADPLVEATDGNFYGTTNVGGNSRNCGHWGCGVVFKLTPTGKLHVLHNFSVGDGNYPTAPLIQASDGNFYGTVPQGGYGYDYGVVFKITSKGKFTLLHIFTGDGDGIAPNAALVEATDGNFYGTTFGGGTAGSGTIYKISPDGTYSVIYSFDGVAAFPHATLVQHTNGKLYGSTLGYPINYGTLYSVDLGLGPFASLVSTTGKVGKSIGILGQGFTGTTSVAFNGTSAKFSVVSDTYLTATVPNGATTGFVTVATPSGQLKSNKEFRLAH